MHDEFSNDELKINGFDFFRKDRQSHGGGLIIYTKSCLSCTRRIDLETNDLETIWLEVKRNKQKAFLMCYSYRPPTSTVDWIIKMENSIEKAISDQKEIILLGDLNFNLLNENSIPTSWLRMINSLNFEQLINKPTRVTSISETLIDHVYTNAPENITEIVVPYFSISDHYPVCITRKMNNSFETGPVHKSITYRDTKHFDETLFSQELENMPWFMIEEAENANDALDLFVTFFHSVLNNHAPKKCRRVKRSVQPNWMNSEILDAIKTRDKHHRDKNTEQYRLWRNKVKNLIQRSKTEFYSETINNNHNNPKQLWQNLHDITGKSKDHQTSFINDDEGNPILDPETAANTFNDFFTSVFETFQSDESHHQYNNAKLDQNIRSKLPENVQFSISRVSVTFIKTQLENLKINKATGIDDISAKFLKIAAPIICKPLSSILNLSIQQGTYPNNLKKAKVTPIFKSGNKSDPNNYRPISVLPVLSSIFERHISNCVTKYVEEYDLFYHHQSGF
ncbi:MAG: hypothetical protein KZQ70_15025, partial [gamma proteobacterium symbiont of Lucinoma myriamae]|nr:hypothetical protein [gamma proteobacterium symbiont of Lucinoma myriamae]